jgi:hypothetical protein
VIGPRLGPSLLILAIVCFEEVALTPHVANLELGGAIQFAATADAPELPLKRQPG